MTIIEHLIGGQRVDGKDRMAEVLNPATGEVTGQVCLAGPALVDRAVQNARAAFPAWRDTPPLRRARVMMRVKQLLEDHADEICRLITAEHGKTLADSLGELQRGLENIEYAVSVPELLKGEFSRNVSAGVDAWSEFQPLGVVAGITPFNFPAMVPLWMWPMAVACGNCFVLKPSERDPSSALRIAELALEAGLPPGVLNVVQGDGVAVDTLLNHPQVEAVSFVGSTAVAASIYARAAAQGKRVQALGSAKNHAVVMPDADLEAVVPLLMGAAFGSCGERCMAIPMVVAVGDAVGDALVQALARAIARMRVGPGTARDVDMGPLVSPTHLARVRAYVDAGVAEGATLVVDGRGLVVPGHERGCFLGPCLFDHLRPEMSIAREEIFGPVLGVVRVKSLDEAMALIESSEFANGTCLFTQDGAAARHFAERIQVGMVGINVPLPVPVATHSFGGWKRSLFGDLHVYGPDAVRFYTRRKAVTQRWLGPAGGAGEAAGFAFR
jgi:malonate-semialdehyde dehydrogenase (acetylating)/methylmalonate-semialdehyde dehydrogenase